MDIRRGFAEVNGTRLYYEAAGVGPPLVLIHGFSLDCRMWEGQFETFARRHRVIRYDARGYGRSALPSGEWYTHAGDLEALLAHLQVMKAVVVGLSMGGEIALDFALTCPAMVRALTLVDAVAGGFQWSEEMGTITREARAVAQAEGIEAAKRRWLRSPLFAPAMARQDVAARLHEMVSGYSGWHWVNRNPVRRLDPPAVVRLGEIAVPTLVIVGELDLVDFHAVAGTLAAKIPGARKVVLAGAGHMASMEAQEAFNDAVLGFLASL